MSMIVFQLIIVGISTCNWANAEVIWPAGAYGLPKAKTGCPKSEGRTWEEGWLKQDLEDDEEWKSTISSNSHMEAKKMPINNINRTFCMNTGLGILKREWPKGFYCVYKSNVNTCAELGMKEGSVRWTNEDKNNRNEKSGSLPDGTYGQDTLIKYCCQDEGHWYNYVEFPVDQPFYLLPHNYSSFKYPKCQHVKWTISLLEYIVYHTNNDANNDRVGGSHVFMGSLDGKPKNFYCYYKGCRYKMTGNNGSFASLNTRKPEIYPQFQYCSWLITVNKTHGVLLNFTYLNVSNCDENFVKIFDGVNETAPLLKIYCGLNATSGSTIVSSTNNVYVIFKSGTFNDTKVFLGFQAKYIIHLKPTGCRYKMTGNNGSFTSLNPRKPEIYPQFQYCSWLITVNKTREVLLNFIYLKVPNCDENFVKIFDGVNETAPLLKIYCGLNATSGSTIVSSTNNVYVIFKSGTLNGTKVLVGFQAKYTIHLKPRGCRYKMTGNNGSFTSLNPRKPEIYPQFQYCSWLITVNKTREVLLNFIYLKVPNCDENFVKIFDGVNETAPLLKIYCGLNATSGSTIVSSTNNVYVIFKSGTLNGTKVLVGFQAKYTIHLKPRGRCQAGRTGDNVTKGIFYWKTTDPFKNASVLCPYGDRLPSNNDRNDDGQPRFISKTRKARRYCNCNGDTACENPKWDEPNTDFCNYKTFNSSTTTQQLSGLLQSLRTGERTAVNVSEEVVDLTMNTTGFQEDDVDLTLLLLEDIINNEQGELNETGPNIVKTVDNILNVDSEELAKGQKNTNSSTRFLLVLDKYLENVPIPHGGKVAQGGENLAVHVQEFPTTNFQGALASYFTGSQEKKIFEVYNNEAGVRRPTSRVSLTIPKSLFVALNIASKGQKQRLHFAVFRKTPFFQSFRQNRSLSRDATTVTKKNSFVITGSVKGQIVQNLTQPVELSYYPLKKAIDESTACVFWDIGLQNGLGDWSSDGCYYTGTTNGLVNCRCDHLTNFAMLMDVYIDDYNTESQEKALSIISYIGCAVSLLGLFLTIIIILMIKELRSKTPSQILLNFCIALSLTLVVFVTAAERSKTSSMVSCHAAAVALHYFVLVTFMWMAIQAFNMYLAFVKVMPTYISRYMLKCILTGWGLPAIVVMITAALAIDDYGDDHFCRLRGLPFFVAFLTPVLIILVGNSVVFVLIFRSILTMGNKVAADRKVDGLLQARQGAFILVVLGLTWLFGILAISDAKLAFQYLFCIFNSFQGLLVFVLYCVLSADTRAKLGKLLFCKGNEKHSASGEKQHLRAADSKFHTGSTGTAFSSRNTDGTTDSNEFEMMKFTQ